jgi:REP element-mobilizing transposase RayT
VTFCKGNRDPFSPAARDAVLRHCLHDHEKRFQLHAAVVMPDHVHLLLTPLPDQKGWPYALPLILKLLKGTSARSVNKLLGLHGPVWQEESFDHVLRSHESLKEKLEYLRQNPVRRGLARSPEDYPWHGGASHVRGGHSCPVILISVVTSHSQPNPNGGGQECPPHTRRTNVVLLPIESASLRWLALLLAGSPLPPRLGLRLRCSGGGRLGLIFPIRG